MPGAAAPLGASIALRNIQFSQRKVSASGQVQSQQITQPLGNVVFRAAQHTADKLTAITHQLSTDNIHYQAVTPGQTLALAVPYWYRGILTRLDSNFEQAAAPVDMPGDDPGLNPNFSLSNTATTDLGGGIIERTLNFSSITGPVQLEETPLEGTLVVFDGTVPMADLAVQRDQQRDFIHRGADRDHDPLPDVRLCARRTARPQDPTARNLIPGGAALRTHSANTCTHQTAASRPGVSLHCLPFTPCLSKRSR
jgi:hypothetical protein